MLSGPWKLRVGAEDYYLDQVARGIEDYYSGRGEIRGQWRCGGATVLGLAGDVDGDSLRAVMAGLAPGTGLTPNADQLVTHRRRVPGFDLTFSVPKSVSVAYALGDPIVRAEIIDGCEAALDETLAWLEREACHVRRGSNNRAAATGPSAQFGTRRLPGDGFLAASFRHRTSRANDPHLHWHVLVANMTRGPDHRWTALDAQGLYRSKRTAGVMFQQVMRRELSDRLGVIWRPGATDSAEIAGIPTRVLRHFSKRRHDIADELARTGLNNAAAQTEALLKTRHVKDELDDETIDEHWLSDAATVDYSPQQLDELLAGNVAATDVGERFEVPDVDHVTGEIVHRVVTFDEWTRRLCEDLVDVAAIVARHDLTARVAGQLGTLITHPSVERLVNRLIAHPEIVPIEPTPTATGWEQNYTTRHLLRLENEITNWLTNVTQVGNLVIDPAALDGVIATANLGPDQAAVVRHIALSGRTIDVVVGRAGTGKTYTMAALRDVYATAGYSIVGAAPTGRGARELQDGAGIPTTTIAALVHRTDPFTAGTILVIDEAGMTNTGDLHAVLQRANGLGISKLVLVGDALQLPEVGAGGGFALAVATAGADVCELTINRRQSSQWERDVLAELRDGDTRHAWNQYMARDRTAIFDDHDSVHERAVDDWWDHHRQGHDTLLLAGTRQQAAILNQLARTRVAAAGLLTGDPLETSGLHFQIGDRVMCLKNSRTQTDLTPDVDPAQLASRRNSGSVRPPKPRQAAVTNGTLATVTAINHQNRTIDIRTDDGRHIRIDADYIARGRITHGYAMTVHKAQGVTVDYAHVVGPAGLYREAWYVAMSRARHGTWLYATTAEAAALNERSHTTGITPTEDETTPDTIHDALATRRANTFTTVTHPHLHQTSELANIPLDRLEQAAADIHQLHSTFTATGWIAPATIATRAERARTHRGVMHVGARVKSLDWDNIGTVVSINDQIGTATVEYTASDGRVACKMQPWHLIQPIGKPAPATITDTAEQHLRFLDDQAAETLTAWNAVLTANGHNPGDDRHIPAAIRHRTHQLANQLAGDPPDWLTWWLGPRPTRAQPAAVWDEQITRLAAWRERHHLDNEPGYGPPPTNDTVDWERHVTELITARKWLKEHQQITASPVNPADAAHIHRRLAELDQILRGAPADQQPWIDHLLTQNLNPAVLHNALQDAATIQTDRRNWILANWAHVIEHQQLATLAADIDPLAHWPVPPDPAIQELINDAITELGDTPTETRTLKELDQMIEQTDPARQANTHREHANIARANLERITAQIDSATDPNRRALLSTEADHWRRHHQHHRDQQHNLEHQSLIHHWGTAETGPLHTAIQQRTQWLIHQALTNPANWIDTITPDTTPATGAELLAHLERFVTAADRGQTIDHEPTQGINAV